MCIRDRLIARIMEETGMRPVFDLIVSGGQFKQSKPNPEIYHYTAKTLGTVSYTHLDVYKRQGHQLLSCPCFPADQNICVGTGNPEDLSFQSLHGGRIADHIRDLCQVWSCLLYTSRARRERLPQAAMRRLKRFASYCSIRVLRLAEDGAGPAVHPALSAGAVRVI